MYSDRLLDINFTKAMPTFGHSLMSSTRCDTRFAARTMVISVTHASTRAVPSQVVHCWSAMACPLDAQPQKRNGHHYCATCLKDNASMSSIATVYLSRPGAPAIMMASAF